MHVTLLRPRLGPRFGPLSLLVVVGVLIYTPPAVNAIKWIGLAKQGVRTWNQTKYCTDSKDVAGFTKYQIRLCKSHLELMAHLTHAATQMEQVCQGLFTERRWNCTSVTAAPALLADLTGGSREQAYVYSLASASLTHGISRACAQGATTKCSCGRLPDTRPSGDFKWGGCSDNMAFGVTFAQIFSEGTREPKKLSKRTVVNKHNNGVGRQIVTASLSTSCKCHGVSGSCSIKTCWKALPELNQIGSELQERYNVAIEVDNVRLKARNKDKDNPKSRKRRLVAVGGFKKSFDENDLIYYTKSSDYCVPDRELGSLGTYGRECIKDHPGSKGCRSMCCGRGYTSHVVQIKQRCDCKYYWCCYVKCKTCTKKVEVNRCQ